MEVQKPQVLFKCGFIEYCVIGLKNKVAGWQEHEWQIKDHTIGVIFVLCALLFALDCKLLCEENEC